MFLPTLIFVPSLTALAVLVCKGLKQVRVVALAGSLVQLVLSLLLFVQYRQERNAGNDAQWLWEWDYTWFEPLHINFRVGVDGISIAMILLTAFVVAAGVLVSWTMEKLSKEFFFLLIFLGMGYT
jgi:NADH-quinone oxidoreductase subunit M